VVPVLLALRFLLELCLLSAFAVIGWAAFDQLALSLAAAVVLPVIVAVFWGMLLSPRRRIDLPLGVRTTAECLLFAAAAIGLWSVGYPALAWGLGLGELVVLTLLLVSGTPPGHQPDGVSKS